MLKLITKAQAAWATRDRGATAVEYALMVALIAVAIIAIVTFLGGNLAGIFKKSCDALNTAGSGKPCA